MPRDRVTKALIPAAGRGTRFLPFTKSVPKELLPIVSTPALELVVAEASRNRLTDVILVLGEGKQAIADYFAPHPSLEAVLAANGDTRSLATIKRAANLATIHQVEQLEPRGLGDAVAIRDLVEKPAPDQAPSTLAIIGRYVVPPEIFDAIRQTGAGAKGEIQLTDAMRRLAHAGVPVHGVVFHGRRYDTGDRLDYVRAVVQLAARHPDIGAQFTTWLREYVRESLRD